MVERVEVTHQLEIVWSAGLELVEQQPCFHCLLLLGIVLDPGQELRVLWDEHLWVPLELKVNPRSRPQSLMVLSQLVELVVGLPMGWDHPDGLLTEGQISGSVSQEAVGLWLLVVTKRRLTTEIQQSYLIGSR